MKALAPDFYERPVLQVARDLIGCTLEHDGVAGVIVETEAYHHSEPACHAYVGLTPRTSTLFGAPGRAYVYRSYGIHAMFNAVCEREGVGAAVLIRALEPLRGLELMRLRRGAIAGHPAPDRELCSGPGKLAQALAITLAHNGGDLRSGPLQIHGRERAWAESEVIAGERVGISRAIELPWRFCVRDSEHVSRPRPLVQSASA